MAKIEIDLDTIFRDGDNENGVSFEEACRREISERLAGDLRKRLFARLDDELSRALSAQIDKALADKMPDLIEDILNVEYTPVTSFGERKQLTTFRAEIVKAVSAQMVYAPKSYSSDENAFTKAVRSIVDKQTEAVKTEITKHVDAKFKQDAISYAVKLLSERLGLDKKV